MAEQTAESIAQRAFDLNLLSDRELQEIWGEFGRRNVSIDEFVQLLLRRELMTNFQLERLLRGEKGGYFYGDYKVQYIVAGGSFARVYRAVHKETGKVVALKVLRRRYSEDQAQTDQFYREGLMGVSLRHPNIVPIYEAVSKGNSHYLVMEFVEGGNLRDFMKVRKKFSAVEATKVAADVAAGLDYAFQRGISHRDLKLTNVLLSSRGQGKLVDFGLAGADEKLADESITGETLNARTIDYAGLERATGVRKDDARSDIYFIGCIYYHMLSGLPALTETRDRIQRLSKSRFTSVVPIHQACPGIPRVVAAVVNKAMNLDPDKRYQTPGMMFADLRQAADRLAAGETEALVGSEDTAQIDLQQLSPEELQKRQRESARYLPDSQRRALLVVESNSQLQDLFRDALKRYGYRVLVISDAKRAVARVDDTNNVIDGVVLSTGELGNAAVDALIELAAGEQTCKVPVVVLLDDRRKAWREQIQPHLCEHRVIVSLPIKLREFRDVLFRLVPPVATAET
ncbi:MAG TPA: protein kinase [Pirellulales bacterium]|jgi:serine/threonine protein kinase